MNSVAVRHARSLMYTAPSETSDLHIIANEAQEISRVSSLTAKVVLYLLTQRLKVQFSQHLVK